MFDFNASLNDAFPVFPILFTVDSMKIGKNGEYVDVIYVLFLCFYNSDRVL